MTRVTSAFAMQSPISWWQERNESANIYINISSNDASTGQGILIGMLSAFGSAGIIVVGIAIFYFFRYTRRGRIVLDRFGRPGEYDDERTFAREEAEAMQTMDELSKVEYLRAKAFIQANPPETLQTDISLSQFLAIQEKGVSAWEFEPELEIANCFVEARTEIEFFDSECSVQSNLPIPKQNEVYYWEAKVYDKPDQSLISIGVSTKPYPLFRLPGWHRCSIAFSSDGRRRYNQPFNSTAYGSQYVQGDVIGVGYRPRTGSIFFTLNGKKFDDVAYGLKSQNFFPTVGANGPCNIHVNFGQSGFVFIEANVKKWGLAPTTGSLAPPPPYGSEQGSILLETGREGLHHGRSHAASTTYNRLVASASRNQPPISPGPERSLTDISLAQLAHMPSNDDVTGSRGRFRDDTPAVANSTGDEVNAYRIASSSASPPGYSSPTESVLSRSYLSGQAMMTEESPNEEREAPITSIDGSSGRNQLPIPSYEVAVRNSRLGP